MTILELREKRAKAWEAAKAFLDSHRNDKGILSAEDDAAYTRMEQEIIDLGKEIARLERQEALDVELDPPPLQAARPMVAAAAIMTVAAIILFLPINRLLRLEVRWPPRRGAVITEFAWC